MTTIPVQKNIQDTSGTHTATPTFIVPDRKVLMVIATRNPQWRLDNQANTRCDCH